MIRALFLDLDGTLLTSGKAISAENRTALAQCRANGIQVFPATARSPMLDRMPGWTGRYLRCLTAKFTATERVSARTGRANTPFCR